jgi:signal transduction histidine kinase
MAAVRRTEHVSGNETKSGRGIVADASRSVLGAPAEGVPTGTPRGIAWSAGASMVTIVVSLLAMALVPMRHEQRAEPLRALLEGIAEPARAEITALHLALATGEAHLRDYREALDMSVGGAPDSLHLSRYRAEASRAAAAVERLDSLAASWRNDVVDRRADSVRAAAARWRSTGERLVTDPARQPPSSAGTRDALHADHYTTTLLYTARLDDGVAAGARAIQRQLEALERSARRWTVVLAVLAMAGVGAALWLGLAVRRGAQLAEARRRALADVLESKARFTRGLSHDLKNPLGAIDGHAALLEDGLHGPLTDAQRAALGRIRRAIRSLLALVDDLLALARAESGELAVRSVPTDLHAVLRELVEEHQAALLRAGLALEATVPDGPCTLHTDPARVRQVLGNLLSNARKYTPGGGSVSLTVCHAEACVQVIVADTGPGIPDDCREFVFQEFSRVPGTTAPGAGLGLAISRRVARLLGGELSADAVPAGAGARFVLELPIEHAGEHRRGAGAFVPRQARGAAGVG